eukprot:502465_1
MKHFSFSTIVFIGLLCIVGSSSLSETNKNQHVLDTPGDESISEGKDISTWGNSLRGRDLQRYADNDNDNNYYEGIDNENNSDTGDNENNYYYENDTEQNNSNEDEEPEDGDGTNGHGGGNHMHGGYHHQGWRVRKCKIQNFSCHAIPLIS